MVKDYKVSSAIAAGEAFRGRPPAHRSTPRAQRFTLPNCMKVVRLAARRNGAGEYGNFVFALRLRYVYGDVTSFDRKSGPATLTPRHAQARVHHQAHPQ